jgi:hypothetical protein
VIYDLDAGRPEGRGRSSLRMTAVTVVAVGIALVFFVALAFGPGQRESQTPILTLYAPPLPTMARPTFNTQAVPDQTLVLPADVADATFRISHEGFTGLLYNYAIATTYRLRGTGDLVIVAPLPPAEALPYPSPVPGDAPLRVRGRAANWIITDNGVRAIRWLEAGMVFEMSSRTLSVAQLADLANKLR